MEKTSGQIAFEAYTEERGGKNHDGTPTPGWEKLGDGVRKGWEAAALAAQPRYVTAAQWEALDAAGKVHEGYITKGSWVYAGIDVVAACGRWRRGVAQDEPLDWCATARFRSEGGAVRRVYVHALTLPEVIVQALRVLHGPWEGWG